MFTQDGIIKKLKDQVQTTHRCIEQANSEQEKFEPSKKLGNLYWLLGETYFRMFNRSFNFLYLTHAEVHFELAIDALSTIQQQPSIYLSISFFAAQQEKVFYQSDASKIYVDAITEYRVKEKAPGQKAYYHHFHGDHAVPQQQKAKCARFLPPEGYVSPPVSSDDTGEAMELDAVEKTFDFGI